MGNIKEKKGNSIKVLCEYLPLIVFFSVYKFSSAPKPLISATICMVIATFIALIVSYFLNKKLPIIAVFSAVILGIFGGLTIIFDNEIFIKIKPTILNLSFGAVLLYGVLKKKPLLSYILGDGIEIPQDVSIKVSKQWALFFIAIAILNEVIWRNFSTDTWVQFKIFVMVPLSLIFAIYQVSSLVKYIKN